jgi:uncharacterized protein
MGSCPRCAAALEKAEHLGQPVAACGRCGGRWLTPEALGAVVDAHQAGPAEEEARLQVPLSEVRESLRCPDCGAPLETFNYAGDSGVILDHCPRCAGVWLDAGELELAARAVAASRRGLDRDRKRFSADLRREEVRQDALEQQDIRTSPSPSGTAADSPLVGGTEGP